MNNSRYSTAGRKVCQLMAISALVFGAQTAIAENAVDQYLGEQNMASDIRVLLIPEKQAMVSSLITSRVKSVHVEDGGVVKKGEPLFDFLCDEQRALKKVALAKLDQHKAVFESNERLAERNAVSTFDLELSAAKMREGEVEVSVINARLAHCRIKAPYDAKVVKVYVNEFENVSPGQELVSIINDTRLKMVLNLPSTYATHVSTAMTFNVHIEETNTQHLAIIKSISPAIDASSRTLAVVAQITDGGQELRAGMSGSADLSTLKSAD